MDPVHPLDIQSACRVAITLSNLKSHSLKALQISLLLRSRQERSVALKTVSQTRYSKFTRKLWRVQYCNLVHHRTKTLQGELFKARNEGLPLLKPNISFQAHQMRYTYLAKSRCGFPQSPVPCVSWHTALQSFNAGCSTKTVLKLLKS